MNAVFFGFGAFPFGGAERKGGRGIEDPKGNPIGIPIGILRGRGGGIEELSCIPPIGIIVPDNP